MLVWVVSLPIMKHLKFYNMFFPFDVVLDVAIQLNYLIFLINFYFIFQDDETAINKSNEHIIDDKEEQVVEMNFGAI